MATPTHTALEPGAVLGPYLIISRLGESGMVYKAQDKALNRVVALKILPPKLLRDAGFLKRFRREAQAQARLHNPNVIALHSMLDTESGLVLVMEYIEGQTLAQLIRNHGALQIDEALWIFEQVLHGMEHAHAVGIVHRDLKPDNIFITHDRHVKIMDFGLAMTLDRHPHTLPGVALGTLLYTSPEQVYGKQADARSDIYTLGISLFEALTGRLPFQHNSAYRLMNAHLKEQPPNPRTLRQTIPPLVEAVVLKAIEKDPARRFRSAATFRQALINSARRSGIELSVMDFADIAPDNVRHWWRRGRDVLRPLENGLFTRLLAHRRALGIVLDIGLLAVAIGLIVSLGLIQQPTKSIDPTAAPQKRPEVAPPSNTADTTTGTAQKRPPSAPTDAERRKKGYDDLRKAWGN
jgi:serine/threonine-protein kinase